MFYIRQRRKEACLFLSEFICYEFNLRRAPEKSEGGEGSSTGKGACSAVTVGRCFSIELNARKPTEQTNRLTN